MGIVSRGFSGRRTGTESKLPPGQYVTTDFPVLSAGPTRSGGWFVWRTQQAERSQDAPLPWTPRAVEDAPPEADGVLVTVSIDEHFRALARGAVASARDAILDIPEADRSDHRPGPQRSPAEASRSESPAAASAPRTRRRLSASRSCPRARVRGSEDPPQHQPRGGACRAGPGPVQVTVAPCISMKHEA